MLSYFWLVFWVGLVVLTITSGVALRVRLRERMRPEKPHVDDDAVQAIMETGVLTTDEDEPLDLDEIEEEERRFWSESWDEPDEW